MVLQTLLPKRKLAVHLGKPEPVLEKDIRKSLSMNAFTGGDKGNWQKEMSIPADINSKIKFIPAKNNVT